MHVCFSSYRVRQARLVRVREWWRLNYICRPHGVRTSILFWRPINKKDYGMSLLNHSVFPFICYLPSPLSPLPLFWGSYIVLSHSWSSLPSCSARAAVHSGMETGEEGKGHSWSEGWFLLSPPIQGYNSAASCVLKAHDIAVARLPISSITIFTQSFHNKLFSKSTQSCFFVC